jgi:uncharacterized protein (TIGR03435 family)
LILLASARAQSTLPPTQNPEGGRMEFDVASVRLSEPDTFHPPNFALSADDAYLPTHGVFFADFPLTVYIEFAYQLRLTAQQRDEMLNKLPAWVKSDHFTIQARAKGEPTKDEMRLMVRSFLADRFHLVVHTQLQEITALALTLAHPGQTGPKLTPHTTGLPCESMSSPAKGGMTPQQPLMSSCGLLMARVTPEHVLEIHSQNTTLTNMAGAFSSMGEMSRPIVDKTGLTERYDFTLTYAPDPGSPMLPPGSTGATDANAPGFVRALEEQLGLKMKTVKTNVDLLVIDHVERPSEN